MPGCLILGVHNFVTNVALCSALSALSDIVCQTLEMSCPLQRKHCLLPYIETNRCFKEEVMADECLEAVEDDQQYSFVCPFPSPAHVMPSSSSTPVCGRKSSAGGKIPIVVPAPSLHSATHLAHLELSRIRWQPPHIPM